MAMRIVTISRQFGSAGRTIGKKLADRLGIPCYDKKLVEKVAKDSGLSKKFIEEQGEYASSKNGFFYHLSQVGLGMYYAEQPITDQLYVMQYNLIKKLAEKEPCVIIGRCADYILRERNDCINVFIHADSEIRAKRIVEKYGNTTEHPINRLHDKDGRRRVYYKNYTDREWGVCSNYTIALDSGVIGIDECVDILEKLYKSN